MDEIQHTDRWMCPSSNHPRRASYHYIRQRPATKSRPTRRPRMVWGRQTSSSGNAMVEAGCRSAGHTSVAGRPAVRRHGAEEQGQLAVDCIVELAGPARAPMQDLLYSREPGDSRWDLPCVGAARLGPCTCNFTTQTSLCHNSSEFPYRFAQRRQSDRFVCL
jgi:hypothetical protein